MRTTLTDPYCRTRFSLLKFSDRFGYRLALGMMIAITGFSTPALASIFVDWTAAGGSTAAGTLDATIVSMSALANPSIATSDLSGSDFSFAPGSASEESIEYRVLSDWSVTFSTPVTDLLLYVDSWRGTSAGPDPVTYTFDQPFTIGSGLASATVTGNQLSLPGFGFFDGILRFAGPISSLSMSTNATEIGSQLVTFGVVEPVATGAVPEFGSLATWAGLCATGLVAWPRRKDRNASHI